MNMCTDRLLWQMIQPAHADRCLPLLVREASAAEIAACHGPHHMTRVANKTALAAADAMAGGPGRAHFGSDTYVNQHTLLCARLAAGACADVAAAVVRFAQPFIACAAFVVTICALCLA